MGLSNQVDERSLPVILEGARSRSGIDRSADILIQKEDQPNERMRAWRGRLAAQPLAGALFIFEAPAAGVALPKVQLPHGDQHGKGRE